MQEITIGKNEAGQRLDKFLGKYMNLAGKSFLYKMMRKKNITLNGGRCDGADMLAQGDVVRLFLADETIEKFTGAAVSHAYGHNLDILYEDSDILLINKPAGMLSQKAKETDISLVEYLISYLLETKALDAKELRSFKPSVCNRLDRNTGGIVAAGKTLAGLQMLSQVFRDRTIHKYYKCVVAGRILQEQSVDGWLLKDEKTNKVTVYAHGEERPKEALPICTKYEPLASNGSYTSLKVTLITGRSHQIRAHLSSIGHPIIGDYKYGSPKENERAKRRYHVTSQLLYSYRLEFPKMTGPFEHLSGKAFEAPLPEPFLRVLDGEGLNG